ncbi:rab11 family-interacting protein 1 [Poecilia latipinna]|uniref:rab11 family-interacting protein 1 n=1 Tax=Poecilia latipinna TaxID=48699 RepID=UPI00072DA39C|nr:PREDICTED: rab11 family-interacting protein 1 [Poecilia latipinna]
MSLADQQWSPTSVQVTVLQARGLRIKGKSGTNDAYAVMQVGKDKYQTSVAEKSVAPVWKEEASFDLPPLLLQAGGGGGGKDRSTLHVQVLHRALVGPDKLLGQAVINLLQLSEDKTRNKTEWFKLLDKTGKPDKDRGEVLLDVQFMRNNMTASMFDLSAAGKSRSRLGKLKDKVRGKKKELDSSSGVVPSPTQVLTDSEEEDANGGRERGKSKQSKRMSLFSPKSNLQKNLSQSMSVLPAKNSSLSGSQSSGLNVDSSEGKKKFMFKIHKHSSSSDSKDSSSGQQKQEQSNLCINGSHVYCEQPPPRTSRSGSSFSLSSSGRGSMEDVLENPSPSVDSLKAVREYSPWMEEEEEEQKEEEDENIKDLRKEEEEKTKLEKDMREEEEEAIRKQQKELERLAEEKLRQEEEKVRKEEEERQKLAEEERIKAEKQREEELEKMRLEEERIRKEERNNKERREEEMRKQEKLAKEKKENKIKEEEKGVGTKIKLRLPVEITSTNPFDENFTPPEETPKSSKAKPDDQRCQSSAESGAASTSEKDPTNIQREKRAAPKPPGRNQQERQKQKEEETATHLPQINKQNKDKDVKTVSVAPQRSVQMIAPPNRSSKDLRNTQSMTEHDSAKEATGKHNKRPAPSIPCAAEDELHRAAAEIKDGAVCGLNPFEDDEEEENELTVRKDATTFVKTDPVVWPQAADKDSAKVKSSKVARAPLPPDPNDTPSSSTVSRNHDETDVLDDSGATAPNKACNTQQEVKSHVQVQESPNKESKKVVTTAGAREEGPPVISRRLQPVKPLNPLEQQSDSVGKVGNDNNATGLDCNGVQHKTNVGTGRSGPYSQLTREELIALLLKQESQLSERDKKISELEQYIDNLLVRVIEESPSILMSMSSLKKPA